MLSIIIASSREAYSREIEENIAATISIPYEIVLITDVTNGLCTAYNRGAELSNYSLLCFVHDDVLFHTNAWGSKVVKHLKTLNTGVIGVMGGRYKSAFGLGWRDGSTTFYRYNLLDGLTQSKHLKNSESNGIKSRVICLDGAFLCCTKEVWEHFKFDEKNFKGFHFYDTDFTFRVAQEYQNFAVTDILIEHFSHGNNNKEYLVDSLIFDKKHQRFLPATLESLSKKEYRQFEGYALSEKLRLLKQTGFSTLLRFTLLKKYLQKHFNFYQLIRNMYFGFIKP
jgi:hypothetical protein